jgi:hypothetical protein
MSRKEMLSMWVLEWSQKQKYFHIHTVDEMLRANLSGSMAGGKSDYIPIGLFGCYDEAQSASNELRENYPNIFGKRFHLTDL